MRTPSHQRGFSLIELLVVISIIGILAGLAVPVISNFKRGDAALSAVRQVQDEVEQARRLAISQRTTVYMVFCPAGFWTSPAFNYQGGLVTNLYAKQLTGYAFVSLRTVGDQPGRPSPRYLSPWRTLPEGTFVPLWKFGPRNVVTRIIDSSTNPNRGFNVKGFSVTDRFIPVPFPVETALPGGNPPGYVPLPYVAFDYQGRLTSGEDEYIPLAQGSVAYARNATKTPMAGLPSVIETPPGNSTNTFSLIHIDWLTGRTRLEQQRIQ